MFTVRYLGRLFNAQDGFVLKSHPLHSEMPEYNLTLHAQLEISNNNVVLTCKTTRYDAAIHPAIFGRCIDFAKAYMAISTFASGIGHTLVFTEFVDPDGKTFPVFFGNRHATQLCKSFSLPQDFNRIAEFVLTDIDLLYAFTDLAATVSNPGTIALNSARAIERIRNGVAGNTVSLKEAWKIMHDTIRVDEAYLKLITGHSMAPRHGRQFTHQGEINTEISKRAWIVVDRYIEFKKRGRQPLTLVEFPLLAG